jgi:hypothetical protein
MRALDHAALPVAVAGADFTKPALEELLQRVLSRLSRRRFSGSSQRHAQPPAALRH